MMVMIVGIQLFEFHFVIVVTVFFFFFFFTENKAVNVEFDAKIQQVWTFLCCFEDKEMSGS